MEEKYLIKNYMNENNNLDLAKIVNDYTNYIFMIIKNITKDILSDEDIEELISDVFLVVWKNKEKLEKDMPLKPYIAGVSKNIAKNKLRENKTSYNSLETEDEIKSSMDVNEMLESKEEFEIISNELQKLGDDSKIFTMFYYEGKKTKQIANILGYTEFNVSTKLHRIKKKIKQALENRGYYYGK